MNQSILQSPDVPCSNKKLAATLHRYGVGEQLDWITMKEGAVSYQQEAGKKKY